MTRHSFSTYATADLFLFLSNLQVPYGKDSAVNLLETSGVPQAVQFRAVIQVDAVVVAVVAMGLATAMGYVC